MMYLKGTDQVKTGDRVADANDLTREGDVIAVIDDTNIDVKFDDAKNSSHYEYWHLAKVS